MAVHQRVTAATPIEHALTRLTRRQLADLIEAAISVLDAANDPDIEPNGDELDGSMGEDDFHSPHTNDPGAGCPVSDPDVCQAGDHGGGYVVLGSRGGWGSEYEDGDIENWRQPAHLN